MPYKPQAALSMPKLNYTKRTYEHMAALADQRSNGRNSYVANDVKFYRGKDGDNRVRVLPPTWDAPEHWGLNLWTHFGVGAENDAYLCPAKHNQGDGRCPICEAASQTDSKEEQSELKPKHRIGVYLISRGKEEEGVVFWGMPFNLNSDFILACLDKFTREYYPPDDIEKGFDHVFVRTGQGDRTRYSGVQISRTPSPLHNDPATVAAWVKYTKDKPLPSVLKFYDYDFIKREFYGSNVSVAMTATTLPAETVAESKPAMVSAQFTATEVKADPTASEPVYPRSLEEVQALSFEDAASLANDLHVNLEQIEDELQLREAICKALGFAPVTPVTSDQSVADKLRSRFANLKK